ncbi:GNAT family N-acetyltransferase [Salmonella enterica subsp. enterica]
MGLYSERLILKPVQPSDVEALFRIYGDPATNTFNPAGPFPDREYAERVLQAWIQHWKAEYFGYWAVSTQAEPERTIGFGGLSVKRSPDLMINNLGYRFETASWGKGYATELARFLIRHGFSGLSLREISATVRANHAVSRRVLEKSGMQYIRDIPDPSGAPPSQLFSLTRRAWLNETVSRSL